MSHRSAVAPDTLSVELEDSGVAVEYHDGREVFYRGVPEKAEGTVTSGPGKDVHVLVTDPTETQGVLVYVNDLKTRDDILEDTGVGRVVVENGDEESLFPGVTVNATEYRVEVDVDFDAVDGRIFVFEEDELGERSFEIVEDA
jgi:hypothetical protein